MIEIAVFEVVDGRVTWARTPAIADAAQAAIDRAGVTALWNRLNGSVPRAAPTKGGK